VQEELLKWQIYNQVVLDAKKLLEDTIAKRESCSVNIEVRGQIQYKRGWNFNHQPIFNSHSNQELWDEYVPTDPPKITIDFNLCDMNLLMQKLYSKRIEPTCLFMVIGNSICN
jgi:hypothetical protein